MEINFDGILVKPFVDKIDSGLITVSQGVLVFATLLALIDFTLTMIRTIENRDQLMKSMMERMLKYTFWFGIILNYTKIKEILLDTFIGLANVFSDKNIDTSVIIGDVFNKNMADINKILDAANTMTGLGNMGWKLLYYFCWILAFILLIWIVVSILFAMIAFHFVAGISILFICFATFDGTNSLGEKFITAVVGAGMNLAVILIIELLCNNVMEDYLFPNGAVTDAINKPQLIFGWLGIFAVCGFFITKASSLASIITSGSGEGLTATGLGKAVMSQVSGVISAAGVVVTAGAAGAGAIAGATGGMVSQTMGATKTVSTAVNGVKTGTMATNTATKSQKVQAVLKGGFEGAKEGFKKGKTVGRITSKAIKNTADVASKGIKIVTDDPIDNVKSILSGKGISTGIETEKLTEEEKAVIKKSAENVVITGAKGINYGLNNIENIVEEFNLNYKTFKESKISKKILENVKEFRNGYKGILPERSATKINFVANKLGKLAKWSNEKIKDRRENVKNVFKSIYERLKKRNNSKKSSNYRNKNNKETNNNFTQYTWKSDKDPWEEE